MKKSIPILLRIIVVIILFQALWYKFAPHPHSVYIFTKVEMEPYGRIITGVVELISVILLLIPKTIWIGATLSLGTLSGAIVMHLTVLGVEVKNDDGCLFFTAFVAFIISAIILWIHRKEVKFF